MTKTFYNQLFLDVEVVKGWPPSDRAIIVFKATSQLFSFSFDPLAEACYTQRTKSTTLKDLMNISETFLSPFLPYTTLISVFAAQMALQGFLPQFLSFISPITNHSKLLGERVYTGWGYPS